MIRRLGRIIDETRFAPPRGRMAIGWGYNGSPRTYRLLRVPAWHARLARAVLTSVA
jgi:hypothetical protein